MKKVFILSVLILFCSGIVLYFNSQNIKCASFAIENKGGCCSGHGGVCGCTKYGKQRCCDGTLSKTCKCRF